MKKYRKLAKILSVSLWRNALQSARVAAGVEHAPVLETLTGCRTVVDIGANRGQFALVARHVMPAARIISFEPLPGPAEKYRRVFAADVKTQLHSVAIGPDAGRTDIHLSARDDSSSLLPISAKQNALFPGTGEVGTVAIDVGPLHQYVSADVLEAPALLKLDVQGFELQALAGCEQLLPGFSWVYVECSFMELYVGQAFADQVIAWLRERNFSLRGVYNVVYDPDGRAVQADFLFGK